MDEKGIAIIGATGGLGEAVTLQLAKRAPVSIGYGRNVERAQSLAQEIRNGGGAAEIAAVDMREAASVKGFIDGAVAR